MRFWNSQAYQAIIHINLRRIFSLLPHFMSNVIVITARNEFGAR